VRRVGFLIVIFILGLGAGLLLDNYRAFVFPPPPPLLSQPLPIPNNIFIKNAVPAEVVRVIDGDTFEVRAFLWHGLEKAVTIRLNGVNTPEKRKRAGCIPCGDEKKLAAKATKFVKKLIGKKGKIYLSNISGGQYDRYTADITTKTGKDLGKALIAQGLAKPYTSKGRACWCGIKP
jgi:endonuclease YncB( thermonuclease family)